MKNKIDEGPPNILLAPVPKQSHFNLQCIPNDWFQYEMRHD